MSSSTATTAPVAAIKITNHETYLSDGIPSPASLLPDPLLQFNEWFNHAGQSVKEHEAFSLTTVSPKGIPSTRYVLLKTVDERGFVFFTNYDSRKGKELFPDGGSKGGYASMAFYWEPLKRSVRIVGRAEKITPEETAEYYHSRPIGSQVGAWASAQSTVLKNREQLEENVVEIEERFDIKDGKTQIPVPPFWGGVRSESMSISYPLHH
jgi:pyridoxamine 5'-phosphate oxidase